MTAIARRLDALGMSRPAFFVPGRIEVLGKHTDYAGGRSLLCAVERGIIVSVTPRSDAVVRVTDRARGEVREVTLSSDAAAPAGDWANYVATVARRLARDFPGTLRGADIAFANDLPVASGLSSSSALTVALFLALDAVSELCADARFQRAIPSNEALAAYLASVEMGGSFGDLAADRGVGTLGGSEDHTAILCCRSGAISQYSFVPTRHEATIPIGPHLTFVVAFSGVAAEKTGRAMALYNELSLGTREILDRWNRATGNGHRSLGEALSSDPEAATRIRLLLAEPALAADASDSRRLRDRFDQFALETMEVIPRAADALARADFATFGDMVNASQLAAETLLGNQIPETRALVRMARGAGALASSAFGAGFGGSVWALVETGDIARFMSEWRTAYTAAFPQRSTHAEFFATRPAGSARAL